LVDSLAKLGLRRKEIGQLCLQKSSDLKVINRFELERFLDVWAKAFPKILALIDLLNQFLNESGLNLFLYLLRTLSNQARILLLAKRVLRDVRDGDV
jgi:hypothetical protein